ncbi:MAG: S-methyl-5-thioribose-1-phosphate isomerase [Spongiibacteraceae bacterium]|nr:S-methyl-5-thioribose-1-phosphate isomerase [Spongiibacteraceae bacterium]
MSAIEPIRWCGDHLQLLDQRQLPAREIYLDYRDANGVATAIREMIVRGAPAIAIAAAYGAVLAARQLAGQHPADWSAALQPSLDQLANSRPTAINLFWALERVRGVIGQGGDVPDRLLELALWLHSNDIGINRRIGDFGATLLPPGARVYTHCNTGALATGGYGTALGIIRSARRDGKIAQVFAGETRPWWQGARLTCWELMREGIPVTLCVEGAAGLLMQRENIQAVLVGADRITANGDVANKIGTYNLAILARHHGLRFIVAAPTSTFDLSLASGDSIPIEQRNATEITCIGEQPLAPAGCAAINPSFDVTPATLIDAIVTEFGIIEQPNAARIATHFQNSHVSASAEEAI